MVIGGSGGGGGGGGARRRAAGAAKDDEEPCFFFFGESTLAVAGAGAFAITSVMLCRSSSLVAASSARMDSVSEASRSCSDAASSMDSLVDARLLMRNMSGPLRCFRIAACVAQPAASDCGGAQRNPPQAMVSERGEARDLPR